MNERQFIKILDAIADRTRLKILKIIAKKGEVSCLEITKKVGMSQPTISHHLKILSDSGILNVRRSGKFGFFVIKEGVINTLRKELKKLIKKHS